jgi:hypothetical protein
VLPLLPFFTGFKHIAENPETTEKIFIFATLFTCLILGMDHVHLLLGSDTQRETHHRHCRCEFHSHIAPKCNLLNS